MAGLLTIFGLSWLLIGSVIGLLLTRRRESHLGEIDALFTHEELLEHYRRDWEYRWIKTCHAHSALFSVVCVVIGSVLNSFDIPPSAITKTLVVLLVSSVVLWTVSSFRSIKPVMAIADLMFVGGISITVYVLFTNTLN